jgi:putative hydrolase of the HAD superfamily
MMPQWLLIDADDTLWDNNAHFERVIERFIRLVEQPSLTAAQARLALDDIERAQLATRGYGSHAFGRNLQDAYQALAGDSASQEALAELAALASGIREEPLMVIEGVRDTLDYLAKRHRLVLFSKGDEAEQTGKLQRSGLAGFFQEALIVREKDPAAYRTAVEELAAPVDRTWMVGNSPRSDINPALSAGLRAVWVPHPDTWRLEQEEVRRDVSGLLVLDRFSELRLHF